MLRVLPVCMALAERRYRLTFGIYHFNGTNRKRYAGSGMPLPYRVHAVVAPQSTRSNTIGYSEPNIPPQSPLSSSCGGVR